MLVKCVCFVLGFICGMAFVIVVSCMVLTGKISDEEWRRENEINRRREVEDTRDL